MEITEQLECILNLSTHTLPHIPQLESIRENKKEIAKKKEKLAAITSDIDRLPIKEESPLELGQKGGGIKVQERLSEWTLLCVSTV